MLEVKVLGDGRSRLPPLKINKITAFELSLKAKSGTLPPFYCPSQVPIWLVHSWAYFKKFWAYLFSSVVVISQFSDMNAPYSLFTWLSAGIECAAFVKAVVSDFEVHIFHRSTLLDYYRVPNRRPGRLTIFWKKNVNLVVIRNWSLNYFGDFVNLVVK